MSTKYVVFWDTVSTIESLGIERYLQESYPKEDILVITGTIEGLGESPGRVYIQPLSETDRSDFRVIGFQTNDVYRNTTLLELMKILVENK